MNPQCKKFHLILIVSAVAEVLLLLVGDSVYMVNIATGLCFGLCLRLFWMHKATAFVGTRRLDWGLLMGGTGVSLLLMAVHAFEVQLIPAFFVAVFSVITYFKRPRQAEAPANQYPG